MKNLLFLAALGACLLGTHFSFAQKAFLDAGELLKLNVPQRLNSKGCDSIVAILAQYISSRRNPETVTFSEVKAWYSDRDKYPRINQLLQRVDIVYKSTLSALIIDELNSIRDAIGRNTLQEGGKKAYKDMQAYILFRQVEEAERQIAKSTEAITAWANEAQIPRIEIESIDLRIRDTCQIHGMEKPITREKIDSLIRTLSSNDAESLKSLLEQKDKLVSYTATLQEKINAAKREVIDSERRIRGFKDDFKTMAIANRDWIRSYGREFTDTAKIYDNFFPEYLQELTNKILDHNRSQYISNPSFLPNIGYSRPIETPRSSPLVVVNSTGQGSFQSNLIDATSIFIAERVKEEVNIAFFERFQKKLDDEPFRLLLPKTNQTLLGTSSFNYSITLTVLKSALEDDLRELPFNVLLLKNSPVKLPDEYCAYAELIKELVRKLPAGANATEVILTMKEIVKNDTAVVKKGITITATVLQSLLSDDITPLTLIKSQEIMSLRNKIELHEVYLELLRRDLEKHFANDTPIRTGLEKTFKQINKVTDFYRNLTRTSEQLKLLQEKRMAEKTGIKAEELFAVYTTLFETVDLSLSILYDVTSDPKVKKVQEDAKRVNDFLVDCYAALLQKDYGMLIEKSINLLKEHWVKNMPNSEMSKPRSDINELLKRLKEERDSEIDSIKAELIKKDIVSNVAKLSKPLRKEINKEDLKKFDINKII